MLTLSTEQELAELIATRKDPLEIVGGGTRKLGRTTARDVLTTRAMTGIQLYEPAALTLVVRAGTPVDEVQETLAAEGQRLPFEPMDQRGLSGADGASTIGGVAAANISGPRRLQVGACRDFMLGIRFVDGRGMVLQNGGRVMKNVTGYDLVKLMAGSRGTLGVLTEISFKVLAIPETEATLVAAGLGPDAGIAALSRALGSPFDVSGAAQFGEGEHSRTVLRIEGLEGSVGYRCEALRAHLGGEWDAVTGSESVDIWRDLRDVSAFAGKTGAVWRVSVKPGDGPHLTRLLEEQGLPHEAIFDWGGGLVWLRTEASGDAVAIRLREVIAGLGGHATLYREGETPLTDQPHFQPEDAALAALSSGLRRQFDPRGILNPGLMG